MPLRESDFSPAFFLRNPHFQTIYPAFFRRIDKPSYRREQLETSDGDFLDLDWSADCRQKLAIISHGMEGSSKSKYVCAMVNALNHAGWDALAWNFRTCGGSTHRIPRFYHSGVSDDLDLVVRHAAGLNRYREIALIGFSMGGNVTLKYLGETGDKCGISKAVAFAAPCDLKSSVIAMALRKNTLYMRWFLRLLKQKMAGKARLFPDLVSLEDFGKIKSFFEFDSIYTARLHGFDSAEDYWKKCSSRPLLPSIKTPTLLISAQDDPFLRAESFPFKEAEKNPYFYFSAPKYGGHMGFLGHNGTRQYWAEKAALNFLHTA